MLRGFQTSSPRLCWPGASDNWRKNNGKAFSGTFAQCSTKWQKGCREVWHPEGTEPMLSDSLLLALTTKLCQSIENKGKWLVFHTFSQFFACWIVVLRFVRLNIKARQATPEFLTTNLWSIHAIALDIDWILFSLHTILINSHCAAHQPQRVKTEKLKFRADIPDSVMCGWSVIQYMIILSSRLPVSHGFISKNKRCMISPISQARTNFSSAGFSFSDCLSWMWRSDKIHQHVWLQQPGVWALEKSIMRPSFFLYFREIRKKRSHWPGGQSAPRLYNCYNLCPCARPAHVGDSECWPGPEFKFSKTVEVGWSC